MKSYFMKSFEDVKVNKWEDENGISRVSMDHADPHDWVDLRIGTKMCKKCRRVEDIGDEFMW